MAYLSRVWLNPLRTGAQKLMRNPHRMHGAVLGSFSGAATQERTLWRLEAADPYRAHVLLVSARRPSLEHIVEQAGWPNAQEPQFVTLPYDTLLDRITRGREFRFRLRANTVATTRNPAAPSAAQKEQLASGRGRGVLVPQRTVEHQTQWLTSRVTGWGFELIEGAVGQPQLEIVGRERISFRKRDDGRARTVVLQTATFVGLLRVIDADAVRRALLDGVGRGRAYGCGLITLAPAHGT